MMRLDTLVASLARERLWITDAYFVGVPGHVQALTAAAADGVDVRLLVPGGSDLPLVRSFSRATYRGLLEGGVRVFEWNGSMLHAKTAVADGLWARVGSTNLNLQSWLGNWELDVAVEDAPFAAAMEAMYQADLENATEVVLPTRHRGHARATTSCRGRADAAPGQVAATPGRRRPWTGRGRGPALGQHRGRRPHGHPRARRGRGPDPGGGRRHLAGSRGPGGVEAGAARLSPGGRHRLARSHAARCGLASLAAPARGAPTRVIY